MSIPLRCPDRHNFACNPKRRSEVAPTHPGPTANHKGSLVKEILSVGVERVCPISMWDASVRKFSFISANFRKGTLSVIRLRGLCFQSGYIVPDVSPPSRSESSYQDIQQPGPVDFPSIQGSTLQLKSFRPIAERS